ncbi:MAG: hypothetical protein U0V04_17455 [Spirosomataceae bacterium]
MKNLSKILVTIVFTTVLANYVNAQTKKSSTVKATTPKTMVPAKVVETKAPAQEAPKATVAKKEVNDKPAVKTKKNYSGSESSFVKGSKYLGGGVSFSGSNINANLSAEYGLTDNIALGGVVWIGSGSFSGGISANYGLGRLFNIPKLDPYIGATIAYQSGQVTTTDAYGNRVDKNGITRVVGQAGVQYRLSPTMIAFFQYSQGLVNGGNGWPSGGIKFSL